MFAAEKERNLRFLNTKKMKHHRETTEKIQQATERWNYSTNTKHAPLSKGLTNSATAGKRLISHALW